MKNKLTQSHLTPINSKYPCCEDTYAVLCIYLHSDQKASFISDMLNIVPTSCENKGDEFINSIDRKRTAKLTLWQLSSENKIKSKDIRDHLDWLLDQLLEKEKIFIELQQKYDVTMVVRCVWWSKGSGGPTLWPDQMSKLAHLNLECAFDIYL